MAVLTGNDFFGDSTLVACVLVSMRSADGAPMQLMPCLSWPCSVCFNTGVGMGTWAANLQSDLF